MKALDMHDTVTTEVIGVLSDYIDGQITAETPLDCIEHLDRRQAAYDVWRKLTLRGTGYEDLAAARTPQELIDLVRARLQPST